MGTFFASRRNQVVVAIVAVIFVVLAAFFLGLRGAKKIDVSTAGTATVSPSPSTSPSPSPLPDPSPSPTVVAVAPPSPVPPPSVAPSSAPPSSPTITTPALTSAGHELQPQDGTGTKPSGPPCDPVWIDAADGWTHVDCGILFLRSETVEGSVGYVVEKKTIDSSTTAWKVFLMTNRGDAADNVWRIRLSQSDESLSRFSYIAVKRAQVAGDSAAEAIVGFRFLGTGHILTYDIVQLRPAQALFIAASRSLDHGSANINGTELADYQPYPDAMAPSYFIRSVIRYSGGAFRISSSTHAPERGPGDLAPPP